MKEKLREIFGFIVVFLIQTILALYPIVVGSILNVFFVNSYIQFYHLIQKYPSYAIPIPFIAYMMFSWSLLAKAMLTEKRKDKLAKIYSNWCLILSVTNYAVLYYYGGFESWFAYSPYLNIGIAAGMH